MGQAQSLSSQPSENDPLIHLAAPLIPNNSDADHAIIGNSSDDTERVANDNSHDVEIPPIPEAGSDEANTSLSLEQGILTRSLICWKFSTREGSQTFVFLKFSLISVLLILAIHTFVRTFQLEHDSLNTLKAIVLYQSNLIWLDLLVFFVVARFPQDVDSPACLLTALTSALFSSLITRFPFLRHSATLYEIHCKWSWMTWAYALAVVIPTLVLIVHHITYAVRRKVLVRKVAEVVFTAGAILGPSALLAPSDFHLHHWVLGWWLGMHCNYPTAYSRVAMAWCWGMYVNGIAVYGRDPIQVCGYVDYYYEDQHCHAETKTYREIPVDWRNCSASGYHP